MSAADFLTRINQIVGFDVTDPKSSMRLNWNNYDEGRALIQRVRIMQKELRLLKQDLTATISSIKSEFTTARTKVGKTFGAGLAAGLFGRKTMGRANAAHRDSLRRSQVQTVAPYENVKGIIDRVLAKLDQIKGQIELSPEYKVRTRSLPAETVHVQSSPSLPPPLPIPLPPPARYYIYLNEEVKGPYSVEQLGVLEDAGTIIDETQCCLEGFNDWIRFSDLPM